MDTSSIQYESPWNTNVNTNHKLAKGLLRFGHQSKMLAHNAHHTEEAKPLALCALGSGALITNHETTDAR